MPSEMAEKIMNDSGAMTKIEADGPFHCHSHKFGPYSWSCSFKLGEECEVPNPMDPTDICKVKHTVISIGNTYLYFIYV